MSKENRPTEAPPKDIAVSLKELSLLRSGSDRIYKSSNVKPRIAMSGQYTSQFRGRGMDFDQVRAYEAGDDIRSIDWRVTARTGKTHTKLFREERARPFYISVDQRFRMFFGSQHAFKSVIAARLAAKLAWHALACGDRVGGLIFSDDEHAEIRPKGGQRGVQQFLSTLVDYNQRLLERHAAIEPNAASTSESLSHQPDAFNQSLERLKQVIKPGSQLLILSDFVGFDERSERLLTLLARHNDITAWFIYDALEQSLPPADTLRISDGNNQISINTRHTPLRTKFAQHFNERHAALEKLCQQLAIKLIA